MATLGILINHYDARNDIRELVVCLASNHRVVLLGPPAALGGLSVPDGVEFRPTRRKWLWWRWLLSQLYRWMGSMPRSRENFYINELFKLNRRRGLSRFTALASLRFRMSWPLRIPASVHFRLMGACDATRLGDIDGFLLITEFSDVALASRIARSGKPHCAYVYSWDHPCKHTVLTSDIRKYALWNTPLVRDMVELQGVSPEQCVVVGATQLAPIHQFLADHASRTCVKLGSPYFYFGCGVGPRDMAIQEMRIIRRIAQVIQKVAPGHLLIVRPYPIRVDYDLRAELADIDIVRWDDGFRSGQVGRSLGASDIQDRLSLQAGAVAFLHIGTTMGFEGAFLGTPCVLVRPPSGMEPSASEYDKLIMFCKQYHLRKHLAGPIATVGIGEDLEVTLDKCAKGWPELVHDNRRVMADTPLQSMTEIARRLSELCLQ